MSYDEILEELNGYIPEGQIEGFPIEIVARMCYYQYEQTNVLDVDIFESMKSCVSNDGGFTWDDTIEGESFWDTVINRKNFDKYFSTYPLEPTKKVKRIQVSLMEIADWKECEIDDIEIVD